MEKTLSLRKDYLNIIEEKNNILLHTNTYLFDYDFDILKKELLKIKKDAYLPNDKILIEYIEPDFYDKYNKLYGLTLRNIIALFEQLDIPLFTLFIVTNNFSIKKELEILDPTSSVSFFCSQVGFEAQYEPSFTTPTLRIDKIVKNCICILGAARIHRAALFNFLKDKRDRVAIVYNQQLIPKHVMNKENNE